MIAEGERHLYRITSRGQTIGEEVLLESKFVTYALKLLNSILK